ncbi:exported hypothetical protein [uncultured Paludibacter sp.]|nr:exported hypothetical protein [uncultured Paludibacter sp.]
MKKILIFTVFLLFSAQSFTQSLGTVGISFSMVSSNKMMRVGENLPADYGMNGAGLLSLGADYIYPLNNWMSVESGLNYSYERFMKTTTDNGNSELVKTEENIHLLSIPVGFRITFLKYGFIDSGVLLDLLNEPGFGSYLGGGVHFQSEYGLGLLLSPYVKVHSLVPFNFNLDTDRIIDTGIKIGITYSIDYFLKNQR